MPCAHHACFDHMTHYFFGFYKGVSEACVSRHPVERMTVNSIHTHPFCCEDERVVKLQYIVYF